MKKIWLCLVAVAVLSCGTVVVAQKGRRTATPAAPSTSNAKPVTVTLVRWPYT